jgi:hypothetical protein
MDNQEQVEQEFEVEFTSTIDYINGACMSFSTLSEVDTAIMSKADEQRVRRIRRKCLKIIDICIKEYYDELFENDEEESE